MAGTEATPTAGAKRERSGASRSADQSAPMDEDDDVERRQAGAKLRRDGGEGNGNDEEEGGEDGEEDDEEEEDVKDIAEAYKIWKKNAPFLYDVVLTHALEWPSLTVQWLKRKLEIKDKDYTEHELLLGTHTSDGAQNHLMIARVKLPSEDTQLDARKYDDERGELGGYGGTASKVEITVRLNHDGEVNRARYMPQDDYVIATKTVSGAVDVFFIRDHESVPAADGPAQPNVRCNGHEQEGYGLDWNPLTRGLLASASDDGSVCVWDTANASASPDGLAPLHKLTGVHDGVVGDVQWHRHHPHLFGTVGDDRFFHLFDTRDCKEAKTSAQVHDKECQTLSFSPHIEYLMLTGGNDNIVKLWDMRKPDRALHQFFGHQGDIFKVEWSPFSEAVIASCSADRRVMVWDLGRIGLEQSQEEAEDGPPELIFTHGGHTGKVSDFSWNSNDPWMISSVSEDNVVQVWQMAEKIYAEDEAASAVAKLSDSELE